MRTGGAEAASGTAGAGRATAVSGIVTTGTST